MRLSVKKCLYALVAALMSNLYVFAQNVVDSDLSNNAGTNKNFNGQWWLFGVLGLVALVLLVVYSRKRRRKI